jgi:hypothetical protein
MELMKHGSAMARGFRVALVTGFFETAGLPDLATFALAVDAFLGLAFTGRFFGFSNGLYLKITTYQV